MAYTSKAKEKETVTKTVNSSIKEEKKEDTVTISKEEFEQMKNQMQTLMQMIAMGQSNTVQEKKPERYITFVNLSKGKYVLKGSSFYTIDHQFDSRKFIEREAKMIVNNMPESIRNGKIYILDADFVKECELDSVYENLLSNKDLVDLLNHAPSYVVDIYKNACKGQKEIIIDMIENKKLNGEFIDANILLEIGKLCGKDLINIESMEDLKEG